MISKKEGKWMPLVFKQSKLLFLRQISTKARFTFSVLFIFSIISFWFLFFYYPLLKKNKNMVLQFDKLILQQKTFKKVIAKLPELEKESIQFKSDLNVLNKKYKSDVQFVLDNLKKFDLVCKSVEPGEIKDKPEYQKEYFNLRIKGEFENLIGYLNFMQNNLQLIRFKDADLKINKKNQIKLFAKLRFIKLKKDENNIV
ncbi:MAG: hypothetical protein ABIA74_05255 [bacterium]